MSVIANNCVYFYSHTKGEYAAFSQFFRSTVEITDSAVSAGRLLILDLFEQFKDENGVEYCCAEQYMMAGKARAMRDDATLTQIMDCGHVARRNVAASGA